MQVRPGRQHLGIGLLDELGGEASFLKESFTAKGP